MLLMFVILLLGRVETPVEMQLREDTIVIERKSGLDGQRDLTAVDFYDYFLDPNRRYEVAERLKSLMARAAKNDTMDRTTWFEIEKSLRRLPEKQQIKVFEKALELWDSDWTERVVTTAAHAPEAGESLVLRAEQIEALVADATAELRNKSRERSHRRHRRDTPPAPVIAIGVLVCTYIVAKGMTKRLG
ncbi:MAG: hypothetical protein AB7N71_04955 [Phycisphaerae bacterium]